MFFTTQIADYTVSRTLSLESAKRVIERFVFSYFNGGHSSTPLCPTALFTTGILYQPENTLLSVLKAKNSFFIKRDPSPFFDPTKRGYEGAGRSDPRRRLGL